MLPFFGEYKIKSRNENFKVGLTIDDPYYQRRVSPRVYAAGVSTGVCGRRFQKLQNGKDTIQFNSLHPYIIKEYLVFVHNSNKFG